MPDFDIDAALVHGPVFTATVSRRRGIAELLADGVPVGRAVRRGRRGMRGIYYWDCYRVVAGLNADGTPQREYIRAAKSVPEALRFLQAYYLEDPPDYARL